MSRVYLLSATADRTFVSCLDLTQPPERRVVPLLCHEGAPLYEEELLLCDDWRTRVLSRLPKDYQAEPTLWMVACSSGFYSSPERREYEKPQPGKGAPLKLMAESDAVRAYYEARQGAVTAAPITDGVVILSVGPEGFRAERLWMEQVWNDPFQPDQTPHFELLEEPTGSDIIDELLVELNIAPNCQWTWNELPPEQAQLLKRFQESSAQKQRLTKEMRALRLQYLQHGERNDDTEREVCRSVPGEGGFPDLCLKVNRSLLEQAIDLPRRPWKLLYECFMDRVRENWGPIHTVLCNGEDWRLEQLSAITARELNEPCICRDGAWEAVSRGMELLAERMLKVQTLETCWRRLRSQKAENQLLKKVYEEDFRKPLENRVDIGGYVEDILERWLQQQECFGEEVLYLAYHMFLEEFSYTADQVCTYLEEGYLRFQEEVRQEMSRCFAKVCGPWALSEEDAFLREESSFYVSNAYVDRHFSPEVRLETLKCMERHYGFARYLQPGETHPDLQADMLEKRRSRCRQAGLEALEKRFPRETDWLEYVDGVYGEVEKQVLSEISEIMGFYPLEEYCCEKAFCEELSPAGCQRGE